LSESWLSHKLFWVFNFFTLLADFTYSVIKTEVPVHSKVISPLIIITNFFLIILMLKTKARSLERPRPGHMIRADGSLFEQLDNGQTRTTSFGNFRG
jgi:hypothetical protein